MNRKTPLYAQHVQAGGKMVDFSGWDMPLHYGSQIDEHHYVRKDAGMFDVSHMGVVDVEGQSARDFLRYLLSNDVAKLNMHGKALYTCMLNEKGGILDDLIVYCINDTHYRIVVNAAMRESDWQWMQKHAKNFAVQLAQRNDLAILAIQGPHARAKVHQIFPADTQTSLSELQSFQGIQHGKWWIARTGYTGEDGYEIILPTEMIEKLWQDLLKIGIHPCGLGARDTLRLEAGLNLYGSDMNAETTPLETNLAWTVALQPSDREFIGRNSLESQKAAGLKRRLVGVVLEAPGVLRSHQKVKTSHGTGELTSGTYSPTLERSIGFAFIPAQEGNLYEVEIRGKWLPLRIVKPPFVKQGKSLI